MNEPWGIHTLEGPDLGGHGPAAVLGSLQGRTLALWESLDPHDWAAPSRNSGWTVHETARHVADTFELTAADLAGAPSPFEGAGFDPRNTPVEWIGRSADESPAGTIGRFVTAAEQMQSQVEERTAAGDDSLTTAPYGRTHWATLVTHMFWDAWLHERDIALALGRESESTEEEMRLAGLYAALMVLLPYRGSAGMSFTVGMNRSDGTTLTTITAGIVVAAGGETALVASESAPGADSAAEVKAEPGVTAEAAAVIDSLSGRGAPLGELLPGLAPELGLFAAFMAG